MPLEPRRASLPFIARGFVAFGYGALALARSSGLQTIAALFTAWALVDGVLVAVAAVAAAGRHTRWWPLLLQATASIAVGVQLVLRPPVSAVGLELSVALWAMTTGVLAIAGAMMLRRGSWPLGISGVTAVLLALTFVLWPAAGLRAVVALTVCDAAIAGTLLIALGATLRPHGHGALTA